MLIFMEHSGTSEFTSSPLLNKGLKLKYLRTSHTQNFEFSQGVRTHLVWVRHWLELKPKCQYLNIVKENTFPPWRKVGERHSLHWCCCCCCCCCLPGGIR